jgi:hypothetical protein
MKSGSQRRSVVPDDEGMEAELITPLSGPSYGPFAVVKRRWHKPVAAIVADAVSACQGLSDRLTRGVYAPDYEREDHYRQVYEKLRDTTRQQLAALEAFSKIEWSER